MRVCGVICEYNPFHNGHAHHLAAARRLSGADYVVCAMSGPFVQRGGPAIADKWTRAHAALSCGADLVLELPALFAVRAAPDFARAGVALLDGLSVVTHLSFGAENADLDALYRLAAPESAQQSAALRAALAKGLSHPAARAMAMGEDMPPNVTLAVEYLRALRAAGSAMQPVPVVRLAGHHDARLTAMPSATAVRLALAKGDAGLTHCMPPEALRLLLAALPRPLPDLAGYSSVLLYLLRTTPPDALRQAYAIAEGLENRLCREAFQAPDLTALLERVKCRRYPMARIRRLLTCILLGFTSERTQKHPAPEYARVLAFRKSAAPLMRRIQQEGRLPLLVKAADAPRGELLGLDMAAQDVWDLLSGRPAHRDLTEPLRILP